MTEDEFFSWIIDTTNKHLDKDKVFINNLPRYAEVKKAYNNAKKLYPDAKISLKGDMLQMGAMSIVIEFFDVVASGSEEIEVFKEMISNADAFEIYPVGDEKVNFAITFNKVMEVFY